MRLGKFGLAAVIALFISGCAGMATQTDYEALSAAQDAKIAEEIKKDYDGKRSLVFAYVKAGYRGGSFGGYQGWIKLPTKNNPEKVMDGWYFRGKIFWALVPTGDYVLGDLYRNRTRYRMRKRGEEAIRVPIRRTKRVYYAGAYAMVEDPNRFDIEPVEGPDEIEILRIIRPALAGTTYDKVVGKRIAQLEKESKK